MSYYACNATPSPPEHFCIQMGSSVSCLHVSLTVRGSHKQDGVRKPVFETEGEPMRTRTDVRLLSRQASALPLRLNRFGLAVGW